MSKRERDRGHGKRGREVIKERDRKKREQTERGGGEREI